MNRKPSLPLILIIFLVMAFYSCGERSGALPQPAKHLRIAVIGNSTCARMMDFGHFETELHLRYPADSLLIRNLCDSGNTPGFRPHAGRPVQTAYDGAEAFLGELANDSRAEGHYESPDQWLSRLKADVILAFFGYPESFAGVDGLEDFKGELEGFIKHTRAQTYNGTAPPELVLVSPLAYEDLSGQYDLPDGTAENRNLEQYTQAMAELAAAHSVAFLDLFHPSLQWYADSGPLTLDGFQLNDSGYRRFSTWLADQLFGPETRRATASADQIRAAVMEKNFFWEKDFRIPNAVHAYGARYRPFGPDNYPAEVEKTRQLTAIRDTAIWALANGGSYDIRQADEKTPELPDVETNYVTDPSGAPPRYLYGEDALNSMKVPPGYQVELFASEESFPDLANPVQIAFDNQGRLWVATMPSYPHYRPGDPRPNDKLLILEDVDGDGRADKQTVFADSLHLPTGFEITSDGVYVAQGTRLKRFTDTDGDDRADRVETVLSGFDDHDTHHVISAFCADPSGAIYMGEGLFLHSNVETPYGVQRGAWGGIFRYHPARKHLERIAQIDLTNPWGTAFDYWGQPFVLNTSNPDVYWLTPSAVRSQYAVFAPKSRSIIDEDHRVRPTSGLEFVSSRHFPEAVQGDLLLANSIGFLGLKQHQMLDEGTGYRTKHRQDLIQSTDGNFRPVDMEFAPDGSLYLVDWHNVLIGHMQHNARDPLRDHQHGRIYRITYPSRPLVEPARIAGAEIPALLENLKLPEYRTRYRSRRELRGRDPESVLRALSLWVEELDQAAPEYEHHLLEALWVSWGMNRLDTALLGKVLQARSPEARAAGVAALRYMGHQVPDKEARVRKMAGDPDARVRMEALVTASWMAPEAASEILTSIRKAPVDDWMAPPLNFVEGLLAGNTPGVEEESLPATHLKGDDLASFAKGKAIYHREGYCVTCHQENGMGLSASGYPPLVGTEWVNGSEERLIKLTLDGLQGPMTVLHKDYTGQVPMMPFRGLLDDEEIAQVLTYVRNAFGNTAPVIDSETVKRIREETKDRKRFYSPQELKEIHPD